MSIGSFYKQSARDGMITLQPSAKDLEAFRDFAVAAPRAAATAQRRAINKTLRWLRTHIARTVSRSEKIAVTAVRQRLRAYPAGKEMEGKLWFGLNSIAASRIGRVRETSRGVSVAGRTYEGAFFKKVYGPWRDIWIRKASKHWDAEKYGQDASLQRTGWIAENSGRFPLFSASVSLEEAKSPFEKWVKLADERLIVVLKQEFNFEIQKYLKGGARG
ncbi:hypothetical protein ALQ04_01664 [Pseudomonas cichorii]|uniref:Phage-like protein n=1 Tax=Pseudomonas cichorii TaxID=36746 RepID=A0A3M4LWW3_PSECI|nr:hypothetical protein [Pseudomonas cichorii]RMQ45927.1 hypothetical protein ALQ04_01664 [Pseudomonas cichorii]